MNANPTAENALEVERLKTVYQSYAERNFGNSKWSSDNPGNQAILQEREGVLSDLLCKSGFLPLADKRILDVGCGMGGVLSGFEGLGARPENLFGVDLLAERIATAKQLFPRFSFQRANAEALPFQDSSFDIVVLFTVFSSILSVEMTRNVAREVIRVLEPNGAIVWYDFRFNNPSNRNVRGVSARQIRSLFPGFACRLKTVTLLPPLARRLGAMTKWLYSPLAAISSLRSHYLGILSKA